MFPHGRHISDKVIQETSSELSYLIVGKYPEDKKNYNCLIHDIDQETSPTSTSPYASDDLHKFHLVMKEIESHRKSFTEVYTNALMLTRNALSIPTR